MWSIKTAALFNKFFFTIIHNTKKYFIIWDIRGIGAKMLKLEFLYQDKITIKKRNIDFYDRIKVSNDDRIRVSND